MRLPPFLIGAALLFWGVQSAQIVVALIAAIIVEAPTLVRWRWQLSQREFNRISDFSGLLFAILVVYQFNAKAMHGIYGILQMTPMVLLLLLAAQRYSTSGKLRLSTLFVSLRNRADIEAHLPDDHEFDLAPAYLMVCLVAASAGIRSAYFLPVAGGFVLLALWYQRPRRFHALAWMMSIILAAALAFGAQVGVRQMQRLIERTALVWMNQFVWTQPDPDYAATAMGTIGRLKLSDRIRVRLETDAVLIEPILLREASYDLFEYGSWKTTERGFERIENTLGSSLWPLSNEVGEDRGRITIELRKETGVAAIPLNATNLRSDDIVEVQRNAYGAILVEAPPGMVSYDANWGADAETQAPPRASDLALPDSYRDEIQDVLDEIGITSQDRPDAVVDKLAAFFAKDFRYSQILRGRWPGRKPLIDFLLEDRKGHCEYFASGTVLLARAAGVPARYAVGYSISEYSELEQLYIARARHAHAWAQVWLDGRWQVLDTTPALWAELEADTAPVSQWLLDRYSWLKLEFDKLRRGDSDLTAYLGWLLVPLMAILLWRLSRRERIQDDTAAETVDVATPGLDSEFARILSALEERSLGPRAGEPLGAWLERLATLPDAKLPIAQLVMLLQLHNRHRFSGHRLEQEQRESLRKGVQQCLQQLAQQ